MLYQLLPRLGVIRALMPMTSLLNGKLRQRALLDPGIDLTRSLIYFFSGHISIYTYPRRVAAKIRSQDPQLLHAPFSAWALIRLEYCCLGSFTKHIENDQILLHMIREAAIKRRIECRSELVALMDKVSGY